MTIEGVVFDLAGTLTEVVPETFSKRIPWSAYVSALSSIEAPHEAVERLLEVEAFTFRECAENHRPYDFQEVLRMAPDAQREAVVTAYPRNGGIFELASLRICPS
jgi:hypothetical protein